MTIPGVLRGMTTAHPAVRAGSFIGCRNVVDLTEDAKPAHGQNGSYTGWMYNKKAVAVVETAAECTVGAQRAGVPSAGNATVLNSTSEAVGCWLDQRRRLVFNGAATGGGGGAAAQYVCRDLTVNEGVIVGPTGTPQGNFHASVCAAAPESELTPANNPICNFSWYGGGILCCGDHTKLLDAPQPVPPARDTWRLVTPLHCRRPRCR